MGDQVRNIGVLNFTETSFTHKFPGSGLGHQEKGEKIKINNKIVTL